MPLTTSILGVFILGESLGFNFLIGGLIIFAGMVLAATGDKKAPVGADRYTNDPRKETTEE